MRVKRLLLLSISILPLLAIYFLGHSPIPLPLVKANSIVVQCGEYWSNGSPLNLYAPIHAQIGAYDSGGGKVNQATVDYGDGARITSTGVTSNSGCGDPNSYYHYPDIMVGWNHNYTTAGTYKITVTLTDTSGATWVEPEGSVTVAGPVASPVTSAFGSGHQIPA